MRKATNPKPLKIDHSFMDCCIWMSMRYAIGRHTIASCYHASEVAKFFNDNPDFRYDKREHYAQDIRSEISQHLHYYGNVSVEGHNDRVDALTLLLAYMAERELADFNAHRFDINLYRCEVTHTDMTPKGNRYGYGWQMDFNDLMPWVKLAGYLYPNEIITYEYEGAVQEKPGFRFYDGLTVHHVTPEGYIESPSIERYIAPEYITNVKTLY